MRAEKADMADAAAAADVTVIVCVCVCVCVCVSCRAVRLRYPGPGLCESGSTLRVTGTHRRACHHAGDVDVGAEQDTGHTVQQNLNLPT